MKEPDEPDTALGRSRARMKPWTDIGGSFDEAKRLHDLHEKEQRRDRRWWVRNGGWTLFAAFVLFIIIRILLEEVFS
jgi:hypothetical protein